MNSAIILVGLLLLSSVLSIIATEPVSDTTTTPAPTVTSTTATDSNPITIDRSAYIPVRWYAPFFSGGGYSSEAISFALSLSPYINLQIVQHGDSFNEQYYNGLIPATSQQLQSLYYNMLDGYSSIKKALIIICHSEPGAWTTRSYNAAYQTIQCPPTVPTDSNINYITIGRTMFETDRLPTGWINKLLELDYIWVPTEFHRIIFENAGVDNNKLRVIAEPVDTEFYSPKNAKQAIINRIYNINSNSNSNEYRFLSVFKWEERKAWSILLESYLTEFTTVNDNVRLYILTNAYHSDSDFQTKIQSFIKSFNFPSIIESKLPAISLIQSPLSDSEMPSLYYGANCFVLPSRGEGFGRPHIESMSMELPIIVTNWSGPTEFITSNNSYPLELDNNNPMDTIISGPFKGHQWARPSIKHLKSLMREVYTNREIAKLKGKQARIDIINKYSMPKMAETVLKELKSIESEMNKKFRTHHMHDHEEL